LPAGLDSLGSVELQNSLASAFSLRLPATLAMDFPSVTAIARHIHSQLAMAAGAGGTAPLPGREGGVVSPAAPAAAGGWAAAVVGMAACLPGMGRAASPAAMTARGQLHGWDAVSEVPLDCWAVDDWAHLYNGAPVRFGSFLAGAMLPCRARRVQSPAARQAARMTCSAQPCLGPAGCSRAGAPCAKVCQPALMQDHPTAPIPRPLPWLTRPAADVASFDAAAFGLSDNEALLVDPQQRLLMERFHEAVSSSRSRMLPPPSAASRAAPSHQQQQWGVWVGISALDYSKLATRHRSPLSSYTATGSLSLSVAAGRIAYTFGLAGPAVAIDTACSSSLVATHAGVAALALGQVGVAACAGVNVMLIPDTPAMFAKAGMLVSGQAGSSGCA